MVKIIITLILCVRRHIGRFFKGSNRYNLDIVVKASSEMKGLFMLDDLPHLRLRLIGVELDGGTLSTS